MSGLINIHLSIFVCAAASLFFARVVSPHVSAPYVIAGSIRMSCRLVSSSMSQFNLEDVAVLGNVVHPAVIIHALPSCACVRVCACVRTCSRALGRVRVRASVHLSNK